MNESISQDYFNERDEATDCEEPRSKTVNLFRYIWTFVYIWTYILTCASMFSHIPTCSVISKLFRYNLSFQYINKFKVHYHHRYHHHHHHRHRHHDYDLEIQQQEMAMWGQCRVLLGTLMENSKYFSQIFIWVLFLSTFWGNFWTSGTFI